MSMSATAAFAKAIGRRTCSRRATVAAPGVTSAPTCRKHRSTTSCRRETACTSPATWACSRPTSGTCGGISWVMAFRTPRSPGCVTSRATAGSTPRLSVAASGPLASADMIRAVVAATLSVVCVAGCTQTDESSGQKPAQPRQAGTPAASPVAAQVVALAPKRPIAEWQLRGGPFSFTTGSRVSSGAALQLGKNIDDVRSAMSQVALIFPAPQERPRCIQRVDLSVTATGIRGVGAEIAAYASDEANYLAAAHVPASALDLSRLIDNRPRGYLADVRPGAIRIDITDLYRTWAAGGPFPSQQRFVNRHSPFGVILRPSAADEGRWTLTLANTFAQRPRLRVWVDEACGGDRE